MIYVNLIKWCFDNNMFIRVNNGTIEIRARYISGKQLEQLYALMRKYALKLNQIDAFDYMVRIFLEPE